MNDSVKKYYVFKNDEHRDFDGFFDLEEAISYAMETDSDEVELTVWNSENGYQNREPADYFKTVWKRN